MNMILKAFGVLDDPGTFHARKTIVSPLPLSDYRPPVQSIKLTPEPAESKRAEYLAEYAELSIAIGIMPPDLGIESFKALLVKLDIPIFSLHEVIRYMDAKAEKESKHRSGWEWRPLREKDHLENLKFGTAAQRRQDQYGRQSADSVIVPATDYYAGITETAYQHKGMQVPATHRSPGSSKPYDRTIPLHAVRRCAAIEKDYKGPVSFFVSDYALAPQIVNPDPFLMAVIPNLNVGNGTGRFVIDFWDEPGFGIEQMLK